METKPDTSGFESWAAFPYPDKAFRYEGSRLGEAWDRLHRGDREPFPEAGRLDAIASGAPDEVLALSPGEAAERLQEGWRAYHRGRFAEAVEAGLAVGPLGHTLANKAANIYATYLETDEERRLALFRQSAERAEALIERVPSLANAWYFGAQALGRYSQAIPTAKALAGGLAGKVKNWLEQALVLDEHHADAHIALGTCHAEMVAKAGVLAAALTYGASKGKALLHFERALALNPGSAIARIEFGNGLSRLYGKEKQADYTELYRAAAACEPHDAMERLDQVLAEASLAG